MHVRQARDGAWWVLEVTEGDRLAWHVFSPDGTFREDIVLRGRELPERGNDVGARVPLRSLWAYGCSDFLPLDSVLYLVAGGWVFQRLPTGETAEMALATARQGMAFEGMWHEGDENVVLTFRTPDGVPGVVMASADLTSHTVVTLRAPADGQRRRIVAVESGGPIYAEFGAENLTRGYEGLETYDVNGSLVQTFTYPRLYRETVTGAWLVWPSLDLVAVQQTDRSRAFEDDPRWTVIYRMGTGEEVARLPQVLSGLPAGYTWKLPIPTARPLNTGAMYAVGLSRDSWQLWEIRVNGLPGAD